jgi:hypothetical protein
MATFIFFRELLVVAAEVVEADALVGAVVVEVAGTVVAVGSPQAASTAVVASKLPIWTKRRRERDEKLPLIINSLL